MKIFIVHAHPEAKSFNGALTETARQALAETGHEVRVSDLYTMQFDPVSDRRNFVGSKDPQYYKQQAEEMHAAQTGGFSADIAAEMAKLTWCDALIFQFPLWWFGLPAILKGWADRVLAMGWAYGGGKWYDNGAFSGKRAMCSVTVGGGATMYSPRGLNGNIQDILFPVNHGILAFTGFTVIEPFVVHGPARITEAERSAHLDRYRHRVLHLDSAPVIRYPKLVDYDENYQLRSSPGASANQADASS